MMKKKQNDKASKELSYSYVKQLLASQIGIAIKDVPEHLIIEKRRQVYIYRQIKQLDVLIKKKEKENLF